MFPKEDKEETTIFNSRLFEGILTLYRPFDWRIDFCSHVVFSFAHRIEQLEYLELDIVCHSPRKHSSLVVHVDFFKDNETLEVDMLALLNVGGNVNGSRIAGIMNINKIFIRPSYLYYQTIPLQRYFFYSLFDKLTFV